MLHSQKIGNFYLRGIKILILLIPLLPLYIAPSMVFPYVTGKNFAFRILVEFAAVFWIGLITLNKEYRPQYSAILLSILIFTFIAGLADLTGIDPYNSFWSNYERMEGYITILHLALYFMIIRSVLQTCKDWMLFFNITLAVSFLVGLYALIAPTASEGSLFWMEYPGRIYGTIGNPPFLAAYMLLTIFIGLIAFLNTHKKYLKACYIFLILLNSAVIYLTATRGSILSGVIGLIIMTIFHIFTREQTVKWKAIKITSIAVIVICFIAFAVTVMQSGGNRSFTENTTIPRLASFLSDDSVKARFNSWKMAWNGIKERPLLGWGQENFIGVYTVNPIPFKGEQIWADRAHNIIIEWLINAGVFGFLSYMAILGSAFYLIREGYRRELFSGKEAVAIITALSVYFVQNLFTFDTINTYFIFFALMAYIDVIGTARDKPHTASKINVDKKRTMVKPLGLTLSASLIFSLIFYSANYKPIAESRKSLQISRTVTDYRTFSILLSDFKDTLAFKTFGDNDVRNRMEFLSRSILLREQFSEDSLKFLEETVRELEKGIYRNNHNLEYLSGIIELYNMIASYEPGFASKAESLIKGCMNINARYEWLYFALADTYKLKKEHDKMFEIVNNMIALDPHNDRKQLKLALAAISLKKEETVEQALEEIKKIRAAKNADIASGKYPVFEVKELYLITEGYMEVKNFEKVIGYLNQIVVMTPDRAKVHYDLATTYLTVGNKTNALEEAKKASELDPLNYSKAVVSIMDSFNK